MKWGDWAMLPLRKVPALKVYVFRTLVDRFLWLCSSNTKYFANILYILVFTTYCHLIKSTPTTLIHIIIFYFLITLVNCFPFFAISFDWNYITGSSCRCVCVCVFIYWTATYTQKTIKIFNDGKVNSLKLWFLFSQ